MRIDLYEQGGYAGGGITENGGNISGPLLLAGNPSQTLEAVPKQYVDAYYTSINANTLNSGTLSPARLPAFSGDLISVQGSNTLTLSNTGVTPGSYPKVSVNAKGRVIAGSNITDSDIPFGIDWNKINQNSLPITLSGYGITDGVSVSGANLTGFLSLTQMPTLGSHAVKKQYVDSLLSSGGIAVGDILRKPYSTTPAGFLRCNGAEVDKTTYAALYSVIGDNYLNNSMPGSGQPWKQQYQINTTQSDDINAWSTESTGLPNGLYYSTAIVTKNRVYMLGGWNGAYTSAVLTAPINADGTLGTWASGTALPGILSLTTSVITKNRVYLFGGYTDNSVTTATVYTAPINADGTLGTWTTSTSLPLNVGWATAFITKNRVYFIGGSTGGGSHQSAIYTAIINSDGTLGAWSAATPFPIATAGHSLVITKNRVYVLYGYNNSTIYTAPINADGTLGAWSNTNTTLPAPLHNSQTYVTKNRAYLIGGYNGSVYTNVVYTAPINTDGTLGAWGISASLPSACGTSQVIATKNRLYMLGGQASGGGLISSIFSASINGGMNDYSGYYQDDATNYMMLGSGKPWQLQYDFNTTQSNDITGWGVDSSTLPAGVFHAQVVVTKNRVHVLGGLWSTYSSTVYTAAINADGTLGGWTTGTSLAVAMGYSQAVVTKNRVYLLGGFTGTARSNVQTAEINADGTLGTWSETTALPAAYSYGQAVVTKNRVYLIAGNYSTVTYTAPINSDGTLGSWTTGTSLPGNLSHSQAVITKNCIYLLGGHTGGAYTNIVYTAKINSDGIIGPWTTDTALPAARGYAQAFVTKNTVYLIGGYTASSVYRAPINEDGIIGTWTTGTALPTSMYSMCAFATKNRLYLLGINSTTIYSAPISSNLNDYSPYYDGTIVPSVAPDSSTKFLLPDLSADELFGSYSYIKF